MIPHDAFTPHGYLDNPFHSWKLNPSGMLRSIAPLGMGWHVPNLGSYARNQFQYTAHLAFGLQIGKQTLLTPEEFVQQGAAITSQVHTKNCFEYACQLPRHGLTLTARYLLVSEHALGCVLTLAATAAQPLTVTCFILHRHTHNPATSRLWEHGLYVRSGPEPESALLGIASEGDGFMHGARSADGLPLTFAPPVAVASLPDASAWARGARVARPTITDHQADSGWQVRTVILPCTLTLGGEAGPAKRTLHAILARGVSPDHAVRHWAAGFAAIAPATAQHRAEDETFWSHAPQLAGDWPESWRRGLVYDLETLRMVIRPPAGMVIGPYDGMQIQAPRLVLAEAALDALFLSYADPDLAARVMLTHFAAAPRPNLPCMREDGSYNMIADDGEVCGTAPSWGWPLWCCDQILRRTGDLAWLRQIYPYITAYLHWWLEHRRDADGWLVYACSWESGQDVSRRFGAQQTGGSDIRHLRPVDLQASMAQGAAILARWATLLGQAADATPAAHPIDTAEEVAWWQAIAEEFTVKTRLLWHDDWFRDYDSAARAWSRQRDPLHLAPIVCGAAGWGHIEQLRAAIANPPMHSDWEPLSWPPVVLTVVEAAAAAQMPLEAAEFAGRYIDSAYQSMDRRERDAQGGLPGITREYLAPGASSKWGATGFTGAGIEGYGWGAVSVHLLLCHLLGLRAEADGASIVAPALPQALRRPGAVYRVGPLPWGSSSLHLACTVRDAGHYTIRISAADASWEADGAWGEARQVRLG